MYCLILKMNHNNSAAPDCQNIMYPTLFHNPYHYQPLIHVPTRTTAVTIGEVGASVDMMRAQLTELSRRMDAMEFNLSKFQNSISNDIYLLKSTLSEHATELLNVRDCVEETRVHVKKTKELLERQDICVDNLADVVRQSNCLHKKQKQQKNVDLGIVRRRLSRVEDFTGEFYEQFESFKSVKDIITGLSDHINECDQDISSFIIKRNENLESDCIKNNYNDPDFFDKYFSNYDDNLNDCNADNKSVDKNDEYETNNLVIFMKEECVKCNDEDDDFEHFELTPVMN